MTTANPAIQALADSPVRRHQSGNAQPSEAAESTDAETAADASESQSESDAVPVLYSSLADLVKSEPVGEKGRRVYKVYRGSIREELFVFTNSPGRAAMVVCNVEAVTQKELQAALVAAVKAK